MTSTELWLALLALLITPGPSNALLALGGAQAGMRAGLRLIPVVLPSYLAVVTPLALWGGPIIDGLPVWRPILTGLAGRWVARLAYGLWRFPNHRADAAPQVTARQMAVTTLLNPKSLIFGLVLIPAAPAVWPGLIAFAALLPLVCTLWAGLGAGVLSRAGPWLNKGAASWLALLSMLVPAKALAGESGRRPDTTPPGFIRSTDRSDHRSHHNGAEGVARRCAARSCPSARPSPDACLLYTSRCV